MEQSGDPYQGSQYHVISNRRGIARLAGTFLVAVLGSFAGVMLWVLIGVASPFWLFLSLPQVLGALFASSTAYLVAGPIKAALSRTMALSIFVAAVCAVANILLYSEMVPGVVAVSDLTPPGGQTTLSVEALLIGAVAGFVVTRGGGSQQKGWIPFCIALFLSTLAVLALVFVALPLLGKPPPINP